MSATTIIDIFFTLTIIGLSLDHLITGVTALFFPNQAIKLTKSLFGFTAKDDDFYKLIMKPWGALGIFAGLVGLIPIIHPEIHAPITVCLIILLLLRVNYRLTFAYSLSIPKKKNQINLALIFLCIFAFVLKLVY